MDKHAFHTGTAFNAYEYLGAHPSSTGTAFCTWAPAAQKVCLIGEFNSWSEQPMKKDSGGFFSLFVKEACPGQLYKYRIYGANGTVRDHADPYGFAMQLRPESASRIVDLTTFTFNDAAWMQARNKNYNRPMNIYELHLGSWRTNPNDENGWYRYDEIAPLLIPYLQKNGYTHVEIMPLSEHPSDASWGYQNTGFYSPTSRYGSPQQLMQLVNALHCAGLGAIIDFVPVHFAVDDYALYQYDGTPLYEYPHADIGYSEWGSYNFNHSRGEVASFLQSAANYWLAVYHFDGIRMDAISRAIYWQGEPERGVNSTAVNFIKNMNQGLQQLYPTAMLFAEDSTAFPQVTAPVQYGGLGFDYKWDLGWMNDTLQYFQTAPSERPVHYHKLTFSMQYFYNELYLLPLSHDEVVHGKATILQKMWGDYELKFPQARAFYMYMLAHPGKKLNFMGNEIGQFREWDETRQQDWDLLQYPLHDGFYHYIRALNKLYSKHPALYAEDYNAANFRWLEVNAPDSCVYIFSRSNADKSNIVIAAFNFSDKAQAAYPLLLSQPTVLQQLISSDEAQFGGEGGRQQRTIKTHKTPNGHLAKIALPAFSGKLFVCEAIPSQPAQSKAKKPDANK